MNFNTKLVHVNCRILWLRRGVDFLVSKVFNLVLFEVYQYLSTFSHLLVYPSAYLTVCLSQELFLEMTVSIGNAGTDACGELHCFMLNLRGKDPFSETTKP